MPRPDIQHEAQVPVTREAFDSLTLMREWSFSGGIPLPVTAWTPSHRKQTVLGVSGKRETHPDSEASCQKLGHSGSTERDTLPPYFTNYVLMRNSIRILETVMCTEWSSTLIIILNHFSSLILENKVPLTFMLHKSHQSWSFLFPWQSLKFVCVNAHNIWD